MQDSLNDIDRQVMSHRITQGKRPPLFNWLESFGSIFGSSGFR
jgi:hypothetical protein